MLATGKNLQQVRKIDDKKSVIDDFIQKQTDPNIIDDMAKGGRVGMAQGGIASKFKRESTLW